MQETSGSGSHGHVREISGWILSPLLRRSRASRGMPVFEPQCPLSIQDKVHSVGVVQEKKEKVAPRKPPLAPSPGVFPAMPSRRQMVPPWRGGLRTPVMRARASPRHVPGRPPGRSATDRVAMRCPGIRKAILRGRTECVPPRKPPFPSSPGFLRKAFLASLGHLAEGRAPHARK